MNRGEIESAFYVELGRKIAAKRKACKMSMRALGVEVARISPQANRTVRVVELFDAVRRGDMPGSQAMRTMQDLMPDRACNGYWHARPGLDLVMAEDTPA